MFSELIIFMRVMFVVKLILIVWGGYLAIKFIYLLINSKLEINIHKHGEKIENGDEKITYSIDEKLEDKKRIEPTFKDK